MSIINKIASVPEWISQFRTHRLEQQYLDKLGIPSWGHLSEDKFLDFMSVMPKMDSKVLLGIIEQIPDFTQLCTEGLSTLKQAFSQTTESNENLSLAIIRAIDSVRESISQELNKENLSKEERKDIRDQLMDLARMYERLDAKNKKFLDTIFGKLVAGVGIAVIAGVFVKNLVSPSYDDSEDDTDEDLS